MTTILARVMALRKYLESSWDDVLAAFQAAAVAESKPRRGCEL